MLNREVLINFGKKIKKTYESEKIQPLVNLYVNNENQLIKIFKKIINDWVFSTCINHYHLLLKGFHPGWLKKEMKQILKEVEFVYLKNPKNIFNCFKKACEDKDFYSYLLIEHGNFYNDK